MNKYCENCGGLLDENGRCPYCGASYGSTESAGNIPYDPYTQSQSSLSTNDIPNAEYETQYPEIECQ